MPFFPKEKVLLIHIPKTGGTSIEKYFAKRNNIELNMDFIYHRYYEQSIQKEFEQLKKSWKQIMNTKTIDLEKTQFQGLQSRKNSLGNDDSSNDGEELQTIKENLPEYKAFKKVRLCKELKHSLQHMTWIELCKYKHILFEQCFHHILSHNPYERNDYEIISVVRNPYDRVISELLFRGIIDNNTIRNPQIVCNKLKKYFQSMDLFDNHKLPQYLFLIDESGDLIQNLIILRTETLTQEMQKLGYVDFNHNFQVSNCRFPHGKTKYSKALNQESIKMINEYYKRDFELFDYKYL
jgi:hypothetical protein